MKKKQKKQERSQLYNTSLKGKKNVITEQNKTGLRSGQDEQIVDWRGRVSRSVRPPRPVGRALLGLFRDTTHKGERASGRWKSQRITATAPHPLPKETE